MGRTYVRKSDRATSYTKQDLKSAIEEVKSGRITAYKASQKYKIPKMTLSYHIRGLRGKKSSTLGRSTVLPLEVELQLVEGITTMEKWGWGLSRVEVLRIVGDYVVRNKLKTPFKHGVPGEDWFLGFARRHGLSIKKPQSVEFSRKKCMDPFIIGEYFRLLEKTLIDLDLKDKPQFIWNMDESGFSLDPSKVKVVGKKGTASSRTTAGSGRDNITVLMAANAAGHKAPPLIIYKGKNIWDGWVAPEGKDFPGTTYAATTNGWMESNIFLNYFEKSFLKEIGDARPVLVIYDGHASHVDERLISSALRNNVTILKLPPHSSHLLQPLDLSVFRSLKIKWDAQLVEWQRRNQGQRIPKQHFSVLIGKIWSQTESEIITNGFRKGGIYPFNSNVISAEHYDPLALKRYEVHKQNLNLLQNVKVDQQETGNAANGKDNVYPEDPLFSRISNDPKVSFQELLLEMVKQNRSTDNKNPKRRIASGAEIITTSEVLKRLQEKDLKKKLKKKKVPEIVETEVTSSEEEPEEVIFEDSDNDVEEELREEEDLNNYMFQMNKARTNPDVNDWVLIVCATKKTRKHYIGQVISMNKKNDEVEIKFTRKVRSLDPSALSSFIWANPEEISYVGIEDIVMILPNPIVTKRGLHRFSVTFTNYNIQ